MKQSQREQIKLQLESVIPWGRSFEEYCRMFNLGERELAFLFLYADKLDETAHIKAVKELCRVADEVRIYPLVDLNAKPSSHLPAVINAMENYGIPCRLEAVNYRFQKNASHMLVLGFCN